MVLEREYSPFATFGKIYVGSKRWDTLERPWANNAPNVSCIPEGTYLLRRDETGKHRYLRIPDEDVAPRSAIEVHPANTVLDLQGCIAVGVLVAESQIKNPLLAKSKASCRELLDELGGGRSHVLTIRRWMPNGMEPRPIVA